MPCLPLEVVAYDKRGDLAVLRFVNAISHEEDGGSAVGFSEDAVCSLQTNASFGESVVAIGNPQGYGITLSEGIVSNPVFDYYESEVGYAHVLTDCPVNGEIPEARCSMRTVMSSPSIHSVSTARRIPHTRI